MGEKSIHSESCIQGEFIGIDYGVWHDLKEILSNTRTKYNSEFRKIYNKFHENASKEQASYAGGTIWRVSNLLNIGDKILGSDSDKNYYVGFVSGDYYYDEKQGFLPHRRKVSWLKQKIRHTYISDELNEKCKNRHTAVNISEFGEEINQLISDSLITNPNQIAYLQGIEGIEYETKYLKKSRNKNLAAERRKIDNNTCLACGFYLKLGENRFVIDVHHINPIGNLKDVTVTKIDELICLCPNCHRIAHSRAEKPLNIEEIKSIII